MPGFTELLSRADEQLLAEIAGPQAIRVLNQINPESSKPDELRKLILRVWSPGAILRTRHSRELLLELLRRDEARELAQALGGFHDGDPYVALRSRSFAPNSLDEQVLMAFIGVSAPAPLNGDASSEFEVVTPTYALFPHQRRAVAEVAQVLNGSGPRRVLLHMPTGSGKTRTAVQFLVDSLRGQQGKLVIWLASSEELCDQAADEFVRAWSTLGDRPIGLHRFWGSRPIDLDNVTDGLVVAGLGKLYSRAKVDYNFMARLADRVSVVVMDEAHQAVAETYAFVLDFLVQRNPHACSLLGLSATPGRSWDDVHDDARLAAFFAKQKVTLRVDGYDNPVQYLVDEGYLASVSFEPLLHDTGNALGADDLRAIERAMDIPAAVLERLGDDSVRNLAIIRRTEQLLEHHSRTILFAASVASARLLALVLQARGHSALLVLGESDPASRREAIERFRSNSEKHMVLVNFGVLTTGFDAPQTSAVLVARPTKSLVLYSQMVGRAIRGPRAGGNNRAVVVTVVDSNLPGFGSIADSFFNWEDVW